MFVACAIVFNGIEYYRKRNKHQLKNKKMPMSISPDLCPLALHDAHRLLKNEHFDDLRLYVQMFYAPHILPSQILYPTASDHCSSHPAEPTTTKHANTPCQLQRTTANLQTTAQCHETPKQPPTTELLNRNLCCVVFVLVDTCALESEPPPALCNTKYCTVNGKPDTTGKETP